MKHPTLFITHRSEYHQKRALAGAPSELEITLMRDPSRAEILEQLPQIEFLISERSGEIDAALIAAGRSLKLIQRLGSQTWDIDLSTARRANIPVCYFPIANCAMVAEHMLMQMLMTVKRARELMHVTVQAGAWGEPRQCTEDYFAYNWTQRTGIRGLRQSTVGILGFGEIGGELARRLRAFDCTLLYNKRTRLPAKAETELGITFAERGELIKQSDFICSLLPVSPQTEQSLDTNFFAAMKPGAIFVHAGAGGVIDETALIAALRSNQLAGAALDTFTFEPMRPNDPLLELGRDPMQNLVLTPGVAASTLTTTGHPRAGDYANILAQLAGKTLTYRLV